MELSENPLPKQQKAFLESEEALGYHKPQYQKDILKHIDKSVKYLYHILKEPHNLKKSDLYDRLNAQTLVDIVEYLLSDFDQKSGYRPEKYDFRTVELSRMLFHATTIYLIKSPIWNDKKFVQSDIDRLSYYFEALAESVLDKQSHVIIKEDEERKMRGELEKIRKEEEFIKNNPEGGWYQYNKQYEKVAHNLEEFNRRDGILQTKKDEIGKNNDIEQTIKQSTITNIENELNTIHSLQKGEVAHIHRVQEKKEESLIDVRKRHDEIIEELLKKYNHLKSFFCLQNRLAPFEYEKNQHLPDKN